MLFDAAANTENPEALWNQDIDSSSDGVNPRNVKSHPVVIFYDRVTVLPDRVSLTLLEPGVEEKHVN